MQDLEPAHHEKEPRQPDTAIPKMGKTALEKGGNRAVDYERMIEAVPIPTYEAVEQFTVEDLDRVYPEWRAEKSDDDPELVAIGYVRTQALRKIGQETGSGYASVLTGGEGLRWAIDHTPSEVGRQYDAHGIANKYDPVAQLDELLQGGIDPARPFYTMDFVHNPEIGGIIGADRPLTTGGFVAVGEIGKNLAESGVKYVVVGEEYNAVLDLLRQRYPEITFIPWDKAPSFFTREANESGKTNIPLETLVPPAAPSYDPVLSLEDVYANQAEPASSTQSTPPPSTGRQDASTAMDEDDMVW